MTNTGETPAADPPAQQPLVMQIVVRRDLLEVRGYSSSRHLASSCCTSLITPNVCAVGGGLGRRPAHGAGRPRYLRGQFVCLPCRLFAEDAMNALP